MKKLLLFIIISLLILGVGCKKKKEESEPTQEIEIEVINGEHINTLYNDNLLSYIIYRAKPSEVGILQSLTFYSFIIKNDITNRQNIYYQVDYKFDEVNSYYHIFDYKDREERQYIQNFLPYNKLNQELLNSVDVLVRYSYDKNNENIIKEIKYHEDIIKFSDDKYNDLNSSDFLLMISKIDNLNSYKLSFSFDSEKFNNGHFDVQTFLKFNDTVYPFYGLYNYGVEAMEYVTYSSEDFEDEFVPSEVYWEIHYYDNEGNLSEYFYKEEL